MSSWTFGSTITFTICSISISFLLGLSLFRVIFIPPNWTTFLYHLLGKFLINIVCFTYFVNDIFIFVFRLWDICFFLIYIHSLYFECYSCYFDLNRYVIVITFDLVIDSVFLPLINFNCSDVKHELIHFL